MYRLVQLISAIGSINKRKITAMNSSFQLQPNPFRFLLYTEWFMLACCGMLAVLETLEQPNHPPIQHFLVLILLGVMGLRLPSGSTWIKVLYTAVEFGLIIYGTALGYLHIMPSLYLLVVIRSCFLFASFGPWLVAGLSFILYLRNQAQYLLGMDGLMLNATRQQSLWMHQAGEILTFGLALFFVVRLVKTALVDRKMQEQLAGTNEQLQQYALQVEDLAAVRERNRIARDIHDSLGHALTALNVQLQTAGKLWNKDLDQSRSFLTQAQRLGELAIKEVRQSVGALRADARQEEPLEAAIESLVEDFRQGTGIAISTNMTLTTVPSPQAIKVIYRIVQEALTNICKHAQATKVNIQLSARPDQVCLTIKDNGRGFQLNSNPAGFGLHSMRERVAALKGDLHLVTAPGAGCCITVELPLQEISVQEVYV
jgi:signal transduction histidine kinase